MNGIDPNKIPKMMVHDTARQAQEKFSALAANFLARPTQPTASEKQLSIAEENFASKFYHRLVEWINDFDAKLDDANEVGVRLVNFGETVKFHLREMSYYNPSLIMFIGELEDGSEVELIQHVSQISILLMKMQRKNPEEPKRQIGFHAAQE